MGSNKTTVAVSGGAAALGTIIAFVAAQFGWNFTGDDAVALGGAIITVVTVVVGFFHKPAGEES